MKIQYKCFLAASLLFSNLVFAQEHFDVEFGYEGGSIIFESGEAGIDAAGIFEAEFEVFNMDGTQVAEDPGFSSNFTEGDEMFQVATGDSVFVNANQSSTLGSFLTYFNPTTGNFESTGASLTIEDNSPALTSNLLVTGTGIAGDLSQFVTTSTGAEVDSHVDFILSSGADAGVYGLLLNIESDNVSGELTDTTSENFWVLFNNGLSETVFENSVSNFAAVPEPSTLVLLPCVAAALLGRRRR